MRADPDYVDSFALDSKSIRRYRKTCATAVQTNFSPRIARPGLLAVHIVSPSAPSTNGRPPSSSPFNFRSPGTPTSPLSPSPTGTQTFRNPMTNVGARLTKGARQASSRLMGRSPRSGGGRAMAEASGEALSEEAVELTDVPPSSDAAAKGPGLKLGDRWTSTVNRVRALSPANRRPKDPSAAAGDQPQGEEGEDGKKVEGEGDGGEGADAAPASLSGEASGAQVGSKGASRMSLAGVSARLGKGAKAASSRLAGMGRSPRSGGGRAAEPADTGSSTEAAIAQLEGGTDTDGNASHAVSGEQTEDGVAGAPEAGAKAAKGGGMKLGGRWGDTMSKVKALSPKGRKAEKADKADKAEPTPADQADAAAVTSEDSGAPLVIPEMDDMPTATSKGPSRTSLADVSARLGKGARAASSRLASMARSPRSGGGKAAEAGDASKSTEAAITQLEAGGEAGEGTAATTPPLSPTRRVASMAMKGGGRGGLSILGDSSAKHAAAAGEGPTAVGEGQELGGKGVSKGAREAGARLASLLKSPRADKPTTSSSADPSGADKVEAPRRSMRSLADMMGGGGGGEGAKAGEKWTDAVSKVKALSPKSAARKAKVDAPPLSPEPGEEAAKGGKWKDTMAKVKALSPRGRRDDKGAAPIIETAGSPANRRLADEVLRAVAAASQGEDGPMGADPLGLGSSWFPADGKNRALARKKHANITPPKTPPPPPDEQGGKK